MTFQKVTVVGGGTLGSQIAFMAAFSGKDTTIWGRSEGSLERAKARVDRWENEVKAYYDAADADIESARDHLNYTTSLEDALAGADLVIEALPENVETKTDFYEKFDKLADPETVVVTNSSTMMPSQFAETTVVLRSSWDITSPMKSGRITQLKSCQVQRLTLPFQKHWKSFLVRLRWFQLWLRKNNLVMC